MSLQAMNQVLERALTDTSFRDACLFEPERALQSLDLTAEEREALTSGEPNRWVAMGVDARIAKRFGPGTWS